MTKELGWPGCLLRAGWGGPRPVSVLAGFSSQNTSQKVSQRESAAGFVSGCLRIRAGTSGHRSGLGRPHQGPTASEHQLRSPGSPGSGQRAHQRGREPGGGPQGRHLLEGKHQGACLHLRGRGAQAAVGRKEPPRTEHLQRAPESQPPQVCGVSGSGSPAGATVVGAGGHWCWSGAWASPSRGGVSRPAPASVQSILWAGGRVGEPAVS